MFRGSEQSAPIAFRGTKETRRLVGDTATESMRDSSRTPSRSERGIVSLASVGIAALAGVLPTLSPCALPLISDGTRGKVGSKHRYGPVALAAGLATSFVAIGIFIATIGYSLGLDAGVDDRRWARPAYRDVPRRSLAGMADGGDDTLLNRSASLQSGMAGPRPPSNVPRID